ncbi:MAG: hypothetical protein KDC38_00490 [Planctomycetes bacterium]|nr:hypothetical protein [Planctomycetota bacterium]
MSDTPSRTSLRSPAKMIAFVGFAAFAVALLLPSVDTKFAEMATSAGRGVQGYRCFVGCFLAPLASPLGTPLWVALSLGNIGVLLFPFAWGHGRVAAKLAKLARWSLSIGAIGAVVLPLVGKSLGILELHWGAHVWTAALWILTVASWFPRRRDAS